MTHIIPETATKKATRGGEFLIKTTEAHTIFTPEDFSEEQKMIASTCQEFVDTHVIPQERAIDAIEENPDLMPSLLRQGGTLGMLGTSVPEAYGGFGMSFNTSMLVAEAVGGGSSFAVALSAHTGIGTLPIVYYGSDAQKQHYLPKLSSGEWLASYCLTEPNSGSDANSGKTKAVLNPEGTHYLITGQKMWITNAGFAEVFIVFAKIDDDEKLTAFIAEKSFGGITMNAEEKKLGIKGSSTRQVFFNDCPIPIHNMLGARQEGFRIALNILNIGRIKLGAAVLGGGKRAFAAAIKYSQERQQFGKQISEFGAIKHKIANMATTIYACESAMYRAGQDIDNSHDFLITKGKTPTEAKLKSVEEFAAECAIIKVHASEMIDFITDETVQIFGGMGFSADALAEKAYRDARINRIFEGTNEINRMLIVDFILKKALKGELNIMQPAQDVAKELMGIPDFNNNDTSTFGAAHKVIANLKKIVLMIAGAAVQKYMMTLKDEQELLMCIADIAIQTYIAESVVLRTQKRVDIQGEKACQNQLLMMQICLHQALDIANKAGKEALYSFAEGDELMAMLMGLKRFTKIQPYNLVAARRTIAENLCA
jgi:alkylation response protein AidB-like acyl-CoA dehydrogenase